MANGSNTANSANTTTKAKTKNTRTPIKFPNRLGLLRTQRDWTQEYVAAAIGISWRHYFRIESGQSEPGAFILRKLAALFGCSMEDLFA